jgi:hypothetical protein
MRHEGRFMRCLVAALCFALAVAIPVGLHFDVIPWPTTDRFLDDFTGSNVSGGVRIEVSRTFLDHFVGFGDPNLPERWPSALRGSIAVRLTHAEAGTITLNFGNALTLTTSAAQDAALERLRAISVARGLPYTTVEIMLRAFLVEHVGNRVQEAKQLDAGEGCERYRTLTAAQQATIDSNLGTSLGLGRAVSPCP